MLAEVMNRRSLFPSWQAMLTIISATMAGMAAVNAAGLKEINAPAEPEGERPFAIVGARLINGLGEKPVEDSRT
jgi:hypothetical protein